MAEEVAFGPRQLGLSKAAARDRAAVVLGRFGKDDWAERPVETLSQGQKHLLCLMAVLATEPEVIVLDEPFTGLDIPTTLALRRHLAALRTMVVHITHDVAALDGYDRVLDGGGRDPARRPARCDPARSRLRWRARVRASSKRAHGNPDHRRQVGRPGG